MACDSPGSARAISGRGMGMTLGLKSLPSASANHSWRLRRAVGGIKRATKAVGARQGTASGCGSGRGGCAEVSQNGEGVRLG